MPAVEEKRDLKQELSELNDPESVLNFLDELGFDTFPEPQNPRLDAFGLRKNEQEAIDSIWTLNDYERELVTYLIKTENAPSRSILRSLPELLRRDVKYPFLIYTNDFENFTFVVVDRQRVGRGEFKTRVVNLELKTNNVKRTPVDVFTKLQLDDLEKPYPIFKKLREAFSVKETTQKFFEEYHELFNFVKDEINDQLHPRSEAQTLAHEYTHQLLNRIMFMHFVQKKGWLGGNDEFVDHFWETYRNETGSTNTFHEGWLNTFFFEAFNNKFEPREEFPDNVNRVLSNAPYLNGGLFAQTELDELDISLDDRPYFEWIFEFFGRYNFTIREDTPMNKSVAVDPEMIGKVYESLVNVSAESKTRGEAGIFYTSRVEIELMVAKSLVEYLDKSTQVPRKRLNKIMFVFDTESRRTIDKKLSDEHKKQIVEALDGLKLLDPAVGSGSFLVGALQKLTNLYHRFSDRDENDFELKKKIIQRSMYGVDVMEWAVRVCELRLWLQLLIETNISQDMLQDQPLLPNLNFKIREGDSLVQEMGGINFASRELHDQELRDDFKPRLKSLIEKKASYYQAETGSMESEDEIVQEELEIFRDIFQWRVEDTEEKLEKAKNQKLTHEDQEALFDGIKEQQELKKGKQKKKKSISRLEAKLENYRQCLKSIQEEGERLFIWDLDFPEIFYRENPGFDVVIGNPPYVRQEDIKPPHYETPGSQASQEEKQKYKSAKREYKEKLVKGIEEKFGEKYRPSKRSDYYLYFYLYGLDLVRDQKGVFCFITSNSWLDVDYGSSLQEFLLDNVEIKEIINNSAKRSFEQADVNTLICLFGPPGSGKPEHEADFVTFKKPFEKIMDEQLLNELEDWEELGRKHELESIELEGESFRIVRTDDFRKVGITQESLKRLGGKKDSDSQKLDFNKVDYVGEKWGGKFLRAPDIFFTILREAGDKLTRLDEEVDLCRGFTTGCNEFFYLPSKHFGIERTSDGKFYELIPKEEDYPNDLRIEAEFLREIIKSPKDSNHLCLKENSMTKKVFYCPISVSELEEKEAHKYVHWGESQGFNEGSTVSSRKNWWCIGDWEIPDLIFPCGIGNTFKNYLNTVGVLSDKRLYCGWADKPINVAISVNSFVHYLFQSLNARYSLGDGLMDLTVNEVESTLAVPIEDGSQEVLDREVGDVFTEAGLNMKKPLESQTPSPKKDRKEIDDLVFDEIGLSEEERNDVYIQVCKLVKDRLEKAQSV